jgi:GAF domain-containing protein
MPRGAKPTKVSDLEKRLTESLEREKATGELLQEKHRALTETLDQQTATSEVLRVISITHTDLEPVFATIVRNAGRVCDAADVVIALVGGAEAEVAAHWGPIEATLGSRFPLTRGTVLCRAILDARAVHVDDLPIATDFPQGQDFAGRLGYRTTLAVPLLRESRAIGGLLIRRAEMRPFSDKQIAMLQTFADQAVIAIENVRLFSELQASNRELTTALDTQTATSDILRVISRSQTDVQPVFDTILASAIRLLGAYAGLLTRLAGEQIEVAALTSTDDAGDAALRAAFPHSRHSEGGHAQAMRDRAPLNVADAWIDPRVPEAQHAAARARGNRSLVVVPLLRHDEAIGAIAVTRPAPGGFTDDEIALLQTFADQAVIAIENVRLFTELQTSNRELTTALDTQTATSDILRVISRAQTEVQPVFDAIVESAVRLLGAYTGVLTRIEGDQIELAALTSTDDAAAAAHRALFPRALHSVGAQAQAMRDRAPLNIADAYTDPRVSEGGRAFARIRGYRSQVVVPMLRHDEAVGTIAVTRREPGGFTDDEIALLQTFADQAVIAIENARLLSELQTSNRELTTALDTQTATSDILRVISGSQTDVQPVFDAILDSAVRLLGAYTGALTRLTGDQIALAAFTSIDDAGDAVQRALFPQSIHSERVHAQTIRDRAPLNIADANTDPRLPEAQHAAARIRGYRSQVVVPMLRHDEAIGAISVTRREPGGFTDDEIALLQTFADQAVIAIENARLLTELQARTAELTQSVDQLTALGEVGQAVSSSLDVDTVLNTIVSRAVELAGADGGTLYEYDERTETFELRVATNVDADVRRLQRTSHLRLGEGAVGMAGATREPVQIPDIAIDGAYDSRLRPALLRAGTRALLAVPLLREERIVGGLVVSRRTPGAFAPEVVRVLQTFATQSALAIQNARLFREIEVKSRELEVASQHKSEFLASMSHELRTPLNAIIGFSDVLLQGMFGDTNDKQTEYLRDILSSGQHLLSLINDILDLSKIEAGRMDLDVAAFDLPTAIDDALLLMRERAGRRGITLERHVDERVGEIRADQRKLKQVLLNLLSNAVKFTPEGGRIDVGVALVDGAAEISVTDTGIGIAPEDQDAVFEEFRQVGAADKKAEGTGLGLALCRKFVELHGGRIWVTSQIGAGSTFTFTLPVGR